ncbi:DUF483 domain-containing protein [Methanothermococcus okinawensis]|uniref:DUF483 domain-containing protein n=1 Tax=Methanothermococcus okinawensis (strain DSM 14208 / JCM 11175 / IH1) TaxID=647113 RepID=F8AK64_METOI|nr:DUF483 domain-containing protein [Methanothermococcus okinawensis]AEH07431.1 protein of unknown function DUF483 [Methanothermococcus okinawensis IH1]
MNAVESMEEIFKRIIVARNGKSNLNFIGVHIENMDDEIYNYILSRLIRQIDIVKKYNPKVRPAIDPMVSSELGVYSGLDFPEEYGALMGYPKCCIESFKSARFGIDNEHLKEAEEIKKEIKNDILENNKDVKEKVAIIMPSGFIPCSLKCKKAWERNLISIVSYKEYSLIQDLEAELFKELPHFHGAYNEYYEKILLL